jgi:ribosome-binding factor A
MHKDQGEHFEKMKEMVKRLCAEFLERESNRDALVSVTQVDLSPDTKYATVYLSVLPETKEHAVIDFAKRMRGEMRTYLKGKMRSRVVPFLEVELDLGEKNRQKIESILR